MRRKFPAKKKLSGTFIYRAGASAFEISYLPVQSSVPVVGLVSIGLS